MAMAKAYKWFSNLLRLRHLRRKPLPNANPSSPIIDGGDLDPNKHAIAVAVATAAVAEAALAAAKAAAEVVRLTTTASPPGYVSRRWSVQGLAAVKIQSVFRGYLARRALRALKGLVKLQALVRGHFVRKQSADMLRRLQALVRVQDRARANRAQNLDSASCGQNNPTSNDCQTRITERLEDPSVLKRCGSISSIREERRRGSSRLASNWLDNWVEAGSQINNNPNSLKTSGADDEKGDKILEVDSWKPRARAKSSSQMFHSSHHISVQDYKNRSFAASDYLARYNPNDLYKPNASPCAEDVASLKSLHFPLEVYTAESSPPQQPCASEPNTQTARKGPMTPMRNEWSRSFFSGYSSPSYMANTESSRAKSRSHSVPRQRQDSEKRGFSKRSLQAFWEMRTSKKEH